MCHQWRSQQVVERGRAGEKCQYQRNHANGGYGLDQAVTQLDEMLNKRLLGAFELVFFGGGITHQLSFCGRKRATLAAPDRARVRMPERALYQTGVAPCLTRHFLPGCR